ncbi:MAG: Type IV pilus assembly protein PilM [Candidatus Giovannonibacteria bacterium GW2011_GWA2_53_7]|uniref:Type IV pilus assembly protein PilM n=1 Tax=Candidatus Giovannonibacteria bacterium GW2011_GWA2_53_7 TaxID=1618650 RepID=A0A0G2AU51_9BACT|nr:MAG: Type IV pilus assembly protein PilM [Candidatus Giovannonibacteria bacterium GW2011_GWA2_53_7]
MFGIMEKKYSLGIDVSATSVKMILLMRQGTRRRLAASAHAALPSGACRDGRIVDEKACGDAIKKAYTQLPHSRTNGETSIIASLPDVQTQSAFITLPATTITKEHVLAEAAKHIPIHTETMMIDWQTVGEKDGTASLVVMTALETTSNTLANTLESAGCFPSVIENETAALARLFAAKDAPQCIIDFGASRTLLLSAKNEIPLFTLALPFTGVMLTDAISQTLHLEREEAEATKRRCGLDTNACDGALREIVNTHLVTTIQKIQMGLEEAASSVGHTPETITLAGGGAHCKAIDTVLSSALAIPVTLGDCWLTVEKPAQFPHDQLAYAVAIGLALRGIT